MPLLRAANFLKKFLLIFSITFTITGVIVILAGITIKSRFYEYNLLLTMNFIYASDVLIFIGCLLVIVSFFACCAVTKENTIIVHIFSVLMVAIFVLEIYAGIGGDLLKNATEEILTDRIQATMQDYGKDIESTVLWDDIHENFRCCGAYSYYEWATVANATHGQLPISCCYMSPGTHENFSCSVHSPDVYAKGCHSKLVRYIKGYSATIEAVGITLSVVQLLVIVFYRSLWKHLPRD